MNTTRLLAALRRAGVFLIAPAVFAGGIGVYAAAQAFWPRLLVWWPWLLAGVAGLVIYGAWWLWWRLPKRQVERLRRYTLGTAAKAAGVGKATISRAIASGKLSAEWQPGGSYRRKPDRPGRVSVWEIGS